jgi:hypothetical protein
MTLQHYFVTMYHVTSAHRLLSNYIFNACYFKPVFRIARGFSMKIFFPLVFLFGCAFLFSCNSPADIQSKWTGSEVPCDADTSRWAGVMQNLDDPQFGIGVQNDGRYVYLRMISWKREVNKQLLRFGFTTWFTSPSKKGKRFGIHFPLGMRKNEADRRAERESRNDPEEVKTRMEEALQEMELLGPGKDDSVPVKTRVAESFGIVVRMFPSEANLVYEMKVPLREDSIAKYAIDIGKDSLMDVAFETDVPDVGAHSGGESHGEGGGMPGGGGGSGMHGGGAGAGGMHGGGGGGGVHGGGGGREGPAEEAQDQFRTSFSLKLAHQPAN